MPPQRYAYYCSGHGYGHATRVSAFACYLRNTQPRPTVHIVSSAPEHVFNECLEKGAKYRFANIDPVIVQPLAYHVDRRKSLEVFKGFLGEKDRKLDEETQWLRESNISCVLSDTAFLPCVAANIIGIPSVLITNFTFDSVYSYLCSPITQSTEEFNTQDEAGNSKANGQHPHLPPDIPLHPCEISHLVEEMFNGYRCSDLLLLLPGYIPIPSFARYPSLPSYNWVDPDTNSWFPDTRGHLLDYPTNCNVLPSIGLTQRTNGYPRSKPRQIIKTPLLVRPTSPDIYSQEGRSRILTAIGVPQALHTASTNVLIVSFGGQYFRRPPSRVHTRTQSRAESPTYAATNDPAKKLNPDLLSCALANHTRNKHGGSFVWVPEAPAIPPLSLPTSVLITPPTPDDPDQSFYTPVFLPDSSWIAVICGMWNVGPGEDLPERFFLAPKSIYMPDLTAIADVLLGKLGYGTVSECVSTNTPFVYVSRPLFIEEHGLRLLLESEGVGVELSREQYEMGDWAEAVEQAWGRGRDSKAAKRQSGKTNVQDRECQNLARYLGDWVDQWQDCV